MQKRVANHFRYDCFAIENNVGFERRREACISLQY
jgi:hypothetical protein